MPYLAVNATFVTVESMDRNATEQEKATAYVVYEFERRAYPLTDAGFTIGRDASSTIVLREPSVSRSHAEIRAEAGEYVLHTSGATGTRLNGEHISTPRQLREGDRIDIGTAELTFRRSRLPLGVSVVDRAAPRPKFDDVETRRTTIANPILGAKGSEGRSKLPMLLLFVILVALAVYY